MHLAPLWQGQEIYLFFQNVETGSEVHLVSYLVGMERWVRGIFAWGEAAEV